MNVPAIDIEALGEVKKENPTARSGSFVELAGVEPPHISCKK